MASWPQRLVRLMLFRHREDGGTLIEAVSASYDGFVSGLVRREYSADRVEAITLNKLSSDNERKAEFDAEFSELEDYRNSCKAQARGYIGVIY